MHSPSWAYAAIASSPASSRVCGKSVPKTESRSLSERHFTSFPAPAGWPLLKKGINPFCGIFQQHVARHRLAGNAICGFERTIDLSIERLLAEADRGRTSRQNDIGESSDFRIQFVFGNDTVDESPRQCGRGIDGLAGQQHLHSPLPADVSHHAYRRRRTEHADIDSRHCERCRLNCYRKIAHRYELATCSCSDAMNAGNHRLGYLCKSDHHPAAGVKQLLLPAPVFRVSAHLLEVVTRAEASSSGSEDHDPYRSVACD